MSDGRFTIELRRQADYRFETHFDDPALPVLVTDEPAPLGGDAGPNPARLLGTAVANCLASSLLFALRKYGNAAAPQRALATVTIGRNAQNRLRIVHIGVELRLDAPAAQVRLLDRVLAQFEEFCVVTQSVRAGIRVDVGVVDGDGVACTAPAAPAHAAAAALQA